ncbi:hypothetical protein GCM10025868_13510 [Angustibacter aerolatus]|uniref:Exodeoxyribonuclease 7 small subunit n=1 Tax=Angustibacter aerolatus TaxID=1162965 RepID=A0ABQ6JEU4_9ACTN|nr:hypothetical protein GCM10025868_13510 [Angustibacter aerolatus]
MAPAPFERRATPGKGAPADFTWRAARSGRGARGGCGWARLGSRACRGPRRRPTRSPTCRTSRLATSLLDVVRRLEAGGTSLEDSLALWERGEALAARCQTWLDGARERLDAAHGSQPALLDDEDDLGDADDDTAEDDEDDEDDDDPASDET